jgi:Na+/proline symporter
MSSTLIVVVLLAYFGMLVGVSFITSGKGDNSSFFLGERKSPWYVVSFGMIGASLSGVTFLSVPGWVGNASNQFSYMQAVLGYLVGYVVIAYVLLPLYYRLNLTSIYEYLEGRFGFWSYKTGAAFFLVSRLIGSSIRLMLVANVLQDILFEDWGVRFEYTVIISVALIWIYTSRGGIKTIVWTDTLQTAFMLASVLLTVWFVSDMLEFKEGQGIVGAISESGYSKIFFFDDINSNNHFLKHFFGGMFITIGMTGLDQDMMQKNLSCRNIKDAQKNMLSMAVVLGVVNLIFLGLGALLYLYASQYGVEFASSDLLFSTIAMSEEAGSFIGVLFLLGLIAAAYSSADSALTALTTSFSVDFLGINRKRLGQNDQNSEDSEMTAAKSLEKKEAERIRKRVHIGMSFLTILAVIFFNYTTSSAAIGLIMYFAGFTYGPLIGLFFFGILTRRRLRDVQVPFLCLLSIGITFLLWYFSAGAPGVAKGEPGIFGAYVFGFELIILNALLTFGLLWTFSKGGKNDAYEY